MATILANKTALRLRLYIAGNAPNSLLAVANLKTICDEYFATGCVVETIDLLVHPARALADSIIVTPTLVKVYPLPVQKVIGTLSDTNQVRLALGVK
jgi:circadian clock protein KaiB